MLVVHDEVFLSSLTTISEPEKIRAVRASDSRATMDCAESTASAGSRRSARFGRPSCVERLNSCFATNTERRRALVFGIGEQCHDILAIIVRAERFAESSQERFGARLFGARRHRQRR